jgi:aminotransferase
MINVFEPAVGVREIEAAGATIISRWIGRGPKVRQLEQVWAGRIGVPVEHVIATTCATEGLFQIFERVLGSGDGERVVMPSNSFVGAANAVQRNGGRPVFCDVDPESMNPTQEHIRKALSINTSAVLIGHYGGVPVADTPEIAGWLRRSGFILVEDCATAPVSTINGQVVGTFGDFAVWSFDAMKVLSAGDGGLIYARRRMDADWLRSNIYLGTSSESGLSSGSDRWWEFDVSAPGRRAIMNDITAAIALAQISRVEELVGRRRALYTLYGRLLKDAPGLTLPPALPPGNEQSYYTYWVQTPRRDEMAQYLRECGIYTTYRYHALHKTGLYESDRLLPGIEHAQKQTLWLPLHPNLTDEQVGDICRHVWAFVEGR